MRATFVITKREFLERVRTKWFAIMTVLGPFLMVALIVIPSLLASTGTAGAKIAIADESGRLGDKLVATFGKSEQQWQAHVVPPQTPDTELLGELRQKHISGFLRIPKDAFEGGKIVYRGDNATNMTVKHELMLVLTGAMLDARAHDYHLSDAQLVALETPPNVTTLHTNGTSEGESGEGTFLVGYIMGMILYMTLLIYGVSVLRSVAGEKSSRVVELMVAATNPRSMMLGKILGVGGAGLVQIGVWLGVGALALAYRDQLLGFFGVAAAGASGLPVLGPLDVAVVLAFFVTGFILYSTMYAAVGAMVSSEQDSQQAAMPISMLLVVGIVSMTAITGDPRGHTAAMMTQIPFWSPLLMPMRYLLGGASLGEVALSLAIIIASTALLARAAAKIYRVGILMYGKRPGLAELWRWLRY